MGVDTKKLEYGPGTISAGLGDSHIPTFYLLL